MRCQASGRRRASAPRTRGTPSSACRTSSSVRLRVRPGIAGIPAARAINSCPTSVSTQPRFPHAQGRPSGIDRDVPELATEAVRAAEQTAAEHDATADAHLAEDADEVVDPDRGSRPNARRAPRGSTRSRRGRASQASPSSSAATRNALPAEVRSEDPQSRRSARRARARRPRCRSAAGPRSQHVQRRSRPTRAEPVEDGPGRRPAVVPVRALLVAHRSREILERRPRRSRRSPRGRPRRARRRARAPPPAAPRLAAPPSRPSRGAIRARSARRRGSTPYRASARSLAAICAREPGLPTLRRCERRRRGWHGGPSSGRPGAPVPEFERQRGPVTAGQAVGVGRWHTISPSGLYGGRPN